MRLWLAGVAADFAAGWSASRNTWRAQVRRKTNPITDLQGPAQEVSSSGDSPFPLHLPMHVLSGSQSRADSSILSADLNLANRGSSSKKTRCNPGDPVGN